MSKLGADPASLRRLATSFERAGEGLEDDARSLGRKIRATGWDGADAQRYLAAWDHEHKPALTSVASVFAGAAKSLRAEATAQERASGIEGGTGGTGTGGGSDGGSGTSPTDPRPGSVWDVVDVAKKSVMEFFKVNQAVKLASLAGSFVQATRLADAGSDAAAAALPFIQRMSSVDAVGFLGTLGTVGKFAGVAGGVLSVVDGASRLFNTQYDGWRGAADRVAGGLGIIGGVGGTALLLGATLNPVGAAVVVGAAAVAGAWALGNAIYDNWPAIQGFLGDAGGYLADGWNDITETATQVRDTAVEAVSDAANAVGGALRDGFGAAGRFVGGLFA